MSTLDEIEEEYQTQKVLHSGTEVQTTVTGVGCEFLVSDEPTSLMLYMEIDVIGAGQDTVGIMPVFDPETQNDIVRLYRCIGEEPQRDLTVFLGQSFDAVFGDIDGEEVVTLKSKGYQVTGVIVEEDSVNVAACTAKLPREITADIMSAYRYTGKNGRGMSVTITDLSPTEEELVVTLGRGCGAFSINRETTATTHPATDYERLIEYVGEGSVKQVEGGEICLLHESERPFPKDIIDRYDGNPPLVPITANSTDEFFVKRVDGFVMWRNTVSGKWVLTASSPEMKPLITPGTTVVVVVSFLILAVYFWAWELLLIGVLLGLILIQYILTRGEDNNDR